jgi:putative ABC transport system permease protein
LHQLATLPSVQRVAIGTSGDVPLQSSATNPVPFSFPDEESTHPDGYAATFGAVSPEYFAVLTTPLKEGRVFTDHDSEAAKRVVVVNEAFARTFSPQTNLIGKRVRDSRGRDSEIVGVVGDVRNVGLDLLPQPRVYASVFQNPGSSLAVFLRTRADVKTMKNALIQTVHAIDPELPVFGVRTMDELMSASMARRRFSLFLMSVFAGLALLLAALGIYGVMAFGVSQRVQEFGIRQALGAQPRDILRLAFRPSLILTVTGTIVGLSASMIVTRLMSSLLFGVSASDPITFAAVPVLLGIVALAACLIPARKATRVSLMQALKS